MVKKQAKAGQKQQQQLANRHLPLLYATSTQLNCFLCLYETLCVCPPPPNPPFLPVYGFIKILLQLFAFAITCLTLCLLIFSSAFLFLQIMKSAAHKICTNYSAASTASVPAALLFSHPYKPPQTPQKPHTPISSFLFFAFCILPTLYFFIYAKCIEKINKIINESRTRLVWFSLLFLLFCYFITVYSPLVSLSSWQTSQQ